jgi:predicted outer membrane repeat protein
MGLTLVLSVLTFPGVLSGKTIYVDPDASGANDGSSWANAYNYLQDALADANSAEKPVEIRVAQGVYMPDRGGGKTPGDWKATFQLVDEVVIKGGFAGVSGVDPDVRDVKVYKTMLSGDLNGDDLEVANPEDLVSQLTRAENSSSIADGNGTKATAVLEGVTVSGGWIGMRNEFGSPTVTNCTFSGNCGGGMFNNYSSATLINCTFTGNLALRGGGVYNNRSNPRLANCTFWGNSAAGLGGGMYNEYSSPTLTNCTFSRNSARSGGGMYSSWVGTPILTDCTFAANRAGRSGGGMYNAYNCKPTITNCTFSGNRAGHDGGGIRNFYNSNPSVANCTFSGNSAEGQGGAMDNSYSSATLTNCILWGNTLPQISANASIAYSDIQGGFTGIGNVDAHAHFTRPGYWDRNGTPEDPNDDFWIDGDYHLKSQAGRWDPAAQSWVNDDVTSSCIDAGDPRSPIGLEPFPNGGVVNMGAYGGTAEASKSYFGDPVCETIVAGDINGDCKVDLADFAIMALHWLEEH